MLCVTIRPAMRLHLVTILTFAVAMTLSAQPASDTAARIIDHQLTQSQSYETLAYLADNIGPRLSGSRGAALAVDWTTKRFRDWGIDVRQERVMVPHWVRGAERAHLTSHNRQEIILTTLGGSVATPPAGITADVIEVTSYEQLAELGREKVAGKIVLYNKAMDMELVERGEAFQAYSGAVIFRSSGASRAAEHGAVAAVVRSVASASLRTPHTGALRYDPNQPRIPSAAVTSEDADLISRLLAKGERVRMNLVLTPRTLPDAVSANVVAEIRGRELPNEIILIGGHLDSWDIGTGAIDNGSGVSMVMETMRLMKELNIQPRRTVRAVLFMNEENGMAGAHAYFNSVVKRGELHRHVAVVETDAGVDDPVGFISTLEGTSLEAARARMDVLSRIGPLWFRSSRFVGADTSPLTSAGIPGFGLVPNPRHYFDYHHTAADTLDKVDPKALARNTAAFAALTYMLAEEGLGE